MKFFSKETCAKLEKIKCKADNSHRYDVDGYLGMGLIYGEGVVEAFTIADFLSDEEYAKENVKKLFGEKPELVISGDLLRLVYAPDQEAFILKALEGKG